MKISRTSHSRCLYIPRILWCLSRQHTKHFTNSSFRHGYQVGDIMIYLSIKSLGRQFKRPGPMSARRTSAHGQMYMHTNIGRVRPSKPQQITTKAIPIPTQFHTRKIISMQFIQAKFKTFHVPKIQLNHESLHLSMKVLKHQFQTLKKINQTRS